MVDTRSRVVVCAKSFILPLRSSYMFFKCEIHSSSQAPWHVDPKDARGLKLHGEPPEGRVAEDRVDVSVVSSRDSDQ